MKFDEARIEAGFAAELAKTPGELHTAKKINRRAYLLSVLQRVAQDIQLLDKEMKALHGEPAGVRIPLYLDIHRRLAELSAKSSRISDELNAMD
jgi:hypothetical protein